MSELQIFALVILPGVISIGAVCVAFYPGRKKYKHKQPASETNTKDFTLEEIGSLMKNHCDANGLTDIKHYSDCAVYNEPAFPAGECNCGGYQGDGG